MDAMSRKDEAARMLLDDYDVAAVAAATGLQEATVEHIANRLAQPVPGDSGFCGSGTLRCRVCGRPYASHSMRRACAALAAPY